MVSQSGFSLTITGSTMEEVRAKILAMAKEFGVDTHHSQLEMPLEKRTGYVVPAAEAKARERLAEAKESVKTDRETLSGAGKKPRGRHKKDCTCPKCAPVTIESGERLKITVESDAPAPEVVEEAIDPVADEIPAAPVEADDSTEPTESISKEVVTSVLQEVNSKRGLTEARRLLEKFGAKRLSELKEDRFPDFVAECRRTIAS